MVCLPFGKDNGVHGVFDDETKRKSGIWIRLEMRDREE